MQNSYNFDLQQFDEINMVEPNSGLFIDQNNLLNFNPSDQNIETQQLFDKTQLTNPLEPKKMQGSFPQVIVKRSNNYTTDNEHQDYDVNMQKLTIDTFSNYQNVDETIPIVNNSIIIYDTTNGVYWGQITDPFITSLSYQKIYAPPATYCFFTFQDGVASLQQYILDEDIQPDTISISKLKSTNATSNVALISDISSNVSLLYPTINLQSTSPLMIDLLNSTQTQIQNSQIESITFNKISNASAGLVIAQNNYINTFLFYFYQNSQSYPPTNNSIPIFSNTSNTFEYQPQSALQITTSQVDYTGNLLYYISNNNQSLPPNDGDLLIYQASGQQFKHQSQNTLSISASQITGLVQLNQIQHQNNANRHWFVSTNSVNSFEQIDVLNQLISLGYSNGKYLLSTSNSVIWSYIIWSDIQSVPQYFIYNGSSKQFILNSDIQSITFSKISDASTVLSYIQNNNQVLGSQISGQLNSIQQIPYGSNDGVQRFFSSINNANSWQAISSLNIPTLNALLTALNTQTQVQNSQIQSITFSKISDSSTALTSIQTNNAVLAGLISGQITIQQVAYGSNDGIQRLFSSINNANSWQPVSGLQIGYSQLTSVPSQLTNLVSVGYGTSGQILSSTGTNYQWINNNSSLVGNNRIWFNNNSGVLTGLSGTSAIPIFTSTSTISTLSSATGGLVCFRPTSPFDPFVAAFSSTYAGSPQCLDYDGSWEPYVQQMNLPSNFQFFAVNRVFRNVLGSYILGFDMYPNITTSTVYKSCFYQSRADGGNASPPINNYETAYLGAILGTSGASTFLIYTNGASQNNIFGPSNTTSLSLRTYLNSATWTWTTGSSKKLKDEVKNNNELSIKHDLCEKLLKTKLNVYTHKSDNAGGRCKKNIEKCRKRKYIGPYIEDLVTDELFYHCIDHIDDLEERGLFDKQECDKDGYKMSHSIDMMGVTYQLINICREQSLRIIESEQKIELLTTSLKKFEKQEEINTALEERIKKLEAIISKLNL